MTITGASFALGPASSWDPETRQFDAVIVSGPETVLTSDRGVRLRIQAEGLDATGIDGGTVPLLHEHEREIQLGRVLSMTATNGRAVVRCCLDDPATYSAPGSESDGSYITRVGRDALHALQKRLERGTQTGFSMRLVDMVVENPRVPGEPGTSSDTPLQVLSGRIVEVSSTTMPGDPGATALSAPGDSGAKLSAPTEPTMTDAPGSTATPTAPTAPTAVKPSSDTAGVGFAAPMTDEQLETLADKLDARQQRRQERFRVEVEEAATEYELGADQRRELLNSGLHGKALFRRAREMDRANRSESLDAPVAARMSSTNRNSTQANETRQAAMAVLEARVGGSKPDKDASQMFHAWDIPSLLDVAQGLALSHGGTLGDGNVTEMAFAALVRDDLPMIMREIVNKRLRDDLPSLNPVYSLLSRQRSVRDYSTIETLGSSPMTLTPRQEGAETRISDLKEEGVTYRPSDADTKVTLSHQVIVGDNIGWLQSLVRRAPVSVTNSLEKLFHESFLPNGTWGDNEALFSTRRGNQQGGALNRNNLEGGIARMKRVPELDGSPANLVPRYLVVPSTLEGQARRLVNDRQSNSNDLVNNADTVATQSRIEVIGSPWIDNTGITGNSTTEWYLFADPARVDGIEHAVLERQPGPYFATRVELNRDMTFYLANTGAFAVANPRAILKGTGS